MDLEAAAAVLGVHYQTAYRWVRNGILPAVRVNFGYELDPEVVVALRDERRRRRTVAVGPAPNWPAEQEHLAGSLLRGDEAAGRRQIERLQGQGVTTVDICDELISGALRWLECQQLAGAILPAEMVAAADLCERLVGAMAAPLPGRPRGLAVVAGPVDEGHRLPSLMATAALRSNRWRVQHLGSGVPARDLAEFVEETRPSLVVLSLTMQTGEAKEFSHQLAASTTVPVLAGGAGERLGELLARIDAAVGPKRSRTAPGMALEAHR
jgi:methanogenic corrinoid protein MtbC1